MIESADFECRRDELAETDGYRFQISGPSGCLSYAHVLQLWSDDFTFRALFVALLAEAEFRAFRWETPPLNRATFERPFEFVILDSPGIDLAADRSDFDEHLGADRTEDGIAIFENLGGDALLVVPAPRAPESAYGHLAAFSRRAPTSQQHALWRAVGKAMRQRVGERPVWLSTAGGGVPWLHVRLDSRPKYYGFAPYTKFPAR